MARIQITLLGREVLPVYYPIMQLRPDKVYLIGTPEVESVAANLKATLEDVEFVFKKVPAFDVKETHNLCEAIHSSHPGDEFSYNITGGTKMMAIGAFISALNHKDNVKAYYTDGKKLIDLSDFSEENLVCKVDTKTFFKLHGQRLRSYEMYEFDKDVFDSAKAIKDFALNEGSSFSRMVKTYKRYGNQPWPAHYDDGRVKCDVEGNSLTVEVEGREVLAICAPDPVKLLFEGRWWETLVAAAISKWSGGRYEIWTSVVFQPLENAGNTKDKNEVDILVNVGNTLLFVECKSGTFNQDNVYKLNSVRNTYGGGRSEAAIISFYPYDKTLNEKAKENKVEILISGKYGMSNIGKKLSEMLETIKA